MKLGFRAKVLLSTTLLTALASICISTLYLDRTTKIVEENYIRSLWNTMTISMNTFNEEAREAYNLAVSMSFDEYLAGMVKTYDNSQGYSDEVLTISEHMKGWNKEDSTAESVYVYLPQRKQVITSIEYRAVQEIFYPYKHQWITKLSDTPSSGFAPELVYDDISRSPHYMLTYAKLLKEGDLPIAAVAINLEERKLFYLCLDSIDDIGAEKCYLLDPKGIIASAASVEDIGISFAEKSDSYKLIMGSNDASCMARDATGNIIASVRSSLTGYRIVSVTDRSELVATLNEQQRYTFLLLFLTLLVTAMIAVQMSKSMYHPIKNLKDSMEKVSTGDLSTRAVVYNNDDIGQLSSGFNEMVTRIDELLKEVLSEQTQKKEAELEALQYQITPHFMYNTLNSIKYAAYLQGSETIGEQLSAFIVLLQTSINNKAAFLSVRDELVMVQNYVKIQLFHYPDSFDVVYNVEKEANTCYVPKLLLQPLVENSIIHGQELQKRSYHIIISAILKGDKLELTVEDDGKGMDAEQLQALMQGKCAQRGQFSRIGVSNVIQRLELYYGKRASLQYTSAIGVGTKAVITLPASRDVNEYRV